MGVGSAPRPCLPGKTHCTGGWVGPRAGLDGCGKSRPPPPGFDPRTAKPVASRYTDWAILPPLILRMKDRKSWHILSIPVSYFRYFGTRSPYREANLPSWTTSSETTVKCIIWHIFGNTYWNRLLWGNTWHIKYGRVIRDCTDSSQYATMCILWKYIGGGVVIAPLIPNVDTTRGGEWEWSAWRPGHCITGSHWIEG
jgi:hypothetical protein